MKITLSMAARASGTAEAFILDNLTGCVFRVNRPGVPPFDGALDSVDQSTNRAKFLLWDDERLGYDDTNPIMVDIATITELVYL